MITYLINNVFETYSQLVKKVAVKRFYA